ncbi:ModD protein [Heliobacterium undosum]|uniref:Putative pyrophosphorylase ModD n=1 Tax=Heliomicrobium undosum TaxID=121734 RepID=A0A845L028_9FIRM|nr:ModD protein [Heliomicrobium undosum]MZP29812.1 ModD protein [Heliomicrobium undosum]
MVYMTDEAIERLLKEDVPYIDLTSMVLGIDGQQGIMRFTSREKAVIAGTEAAQRLMTKLGIEVSAQAASGTEVTPGEVFLEARGPASRLHMAWKVCQNILEYSSGIATRTRRLVEKAKAINLRIQIVTTRKIFPGTKELAIQAVIAGGGFPHRLGLSETVLIFAQHLNFIGGLEGLLAQMEALRARASEKKIIVEVADLEQALRLCHAGVDGLQFDKVPPAELAAMATAIRSVNPKVTMIGTGGINEQNVEDYAKAGVDVISTTWVYFGKPVDIGVRITPV